MRRALPWISLAAGIVLAIATAYVAYGTANTAWSAIVDYESPYTNVPLPPAAAGPAQSDRVVMVLVDGMREEISREMTAVENLRGHGADFIVETPQPSLSYPTWTTSLSGAPNSIHGVTTNWFEGPVPVETLIDTAIAAKKRTVVVGGTSLDELYGAGRADGSYFQDWEEGDYLSGLLVDEALRLVEEVDPSFVFMVLPDLDEAGHSQGPESAHYAEVADRINTELTRLVSTLGDGNTTFVVYADHGHVDGGGHGGWEDEAIHPPAVFAGSAVALSQGEALQVDIAPTVAAIAGIPVPRDSVGRVLEEVVPDAGAASLTPATAQRAASLARYLGVVTGQEQSSVSFLQMGPEEIDNAVDTAVQARLADDRGDRLPLALGLVAGTLALLLVIGVVSWRALVAAGAGALAYQAVYNGLYFLVHGHRWSLSAFNEESMVDAFFHTRMGEAVLAALVAAGVAAFVYVALRRSPKPSRGEFLPGWLALGATTVLVVQVTMAWQIAWYLWAWGIDVAWSIPDLMWGFKFDLDLIQTTALGAAALIAPVVTFLVGRYHPRLRGVSVPPNGSASTETKE